MRFALLLHDYLFWHYTTAYADMVGIARNYLGAVNHMFSILDVVKSLFAPFKRLKEEKVNIIRNPSDFFANLLVNFIMRIVGFIVRLGLMIVALITALLLVVLLLATLLLWTILPALVVYFFMSGLHYLFL